MRFAYENNVLAEILGSSGTHPRALNHFHRGRGGIGTWRDNYRKTCHSGAVSAPCKERYRMSLEEKRYVPPPAWRLAAQSFVLPVPVNPDLSRFTDTSRWRPDHDRPLGIPPDC